MPKRIGNSDEHLQKIADGINRLFDEAQDAKHELKKILRAAPEEALILAGLKGRRHAKR